MYLKGSYADKSAWSQLTVLILLVLAGSVFSSCIAMSIFYLLYGLQAEISQFPSMMRMLQFITATGTFLFPALTMAWLCSNRPMEFLSVNIFPKTNSWLLTGFSIICLTPTISLIGLVNKQMTLPTWMAPIENWMRIQEELAEQITLQLLAGNGWGILLANLFVIALTAAVTEEFLFRGALQRVIGKWTRNHHVIIWCTAILFSAFHMQFFGFIPRLLLGAYFGYLLYWTRSIWIAVFAHFTNNALAVITLSDPRLKENQFITGDLSPEQLLPYGVMASVLLILFIGCCKKLADFHLLLKNSDSRLG